MKNLIKFSDFAKNKNIDVAPHNIKKKWHPNVDIAEIGIGDTDPVGKFKEWVKNAKKSAFLTTEY
jgi:hypothetical protein